MSSVPPEDLPDPNTPPIDTPVSQAWSDVDDSGDHAACVAAFYVTLTEAGVEADHAAGLTESWMLAVMGVAQ